MSSSLHLYILPLEEKNTWFQEQSPLAQTLLESFGWPLEATGCVPVFDYHGKTQGLVWFISSTTRPFEVASLLPKMLPYKQDFVLSAFPATWAQSDILTGWKLGTYEFTRYKHGRSFTPRLLGTDSAAEKTADIFAQAYTLGRDLVNTPACDMPPAQLMEAAKALALLHGGGVKEIVGDALLDENYPLIHAVGRAAMSPQAPEQAPRLIDLRWGNESHPKVTLVGKGVCYDTGGLDIKPSSAMALMKKDMGGAATALALAHVIMANQLPLRLRVLIPAVENAVSGTSYRTGDVYPSRKGLSIEIRDTDAEGRLVLADALAEADSESPDLLLCFATLTGAARAAVGPDLPACFTPDDALFERLFALGMEKDDPLWRLPLWAPYAKGLESRIADLKNVSDDSFAGSSVAALFLKNFIEKARNWVHFDIYAWNPRERPAHPFGGEVMPVSTLFHLLKEKYHD